MPYAEAVIGSLFDQEQPVGFYQEVHDGPVLVDTLTAQSGCEEGPGAEIPALAGRAALNEIEVAWLEVTGQCQQTCPGMCYAESGPDGEHSSMSVEDWKTTIDQLAEQGVRRVRFIGGEPTLYPALPELAQYALDGGLLVSLNTNMVHLNSVVRQLILDNRDKIRLVTSYFSPDPAAHQRITGRSTLSPIEKNIKWATSEGVDVRVGIIGVEEGQDISGATGQLVELGVDPDTIQVDVLRQVGRGVQGDLAPDPLSQGCGNCGDGRLAIMGDGSVQPCTFLRQPSLTMGNVLEQNLGELLLGERSVAVHGLLVDRFGARRLRTITACNPGDGCGPDQQDCPPDFDQPCGPDNK